MQGKSVTGDEITWGLSEATEGFSVICLHFFHDDFITLNLVMALGL